MEASGALGLDWAEFDWTLKKTIRLPVQVLIWAMIGS